MVRGEGGDRPRGLSGECGGYSESYEDLPGDFNGSPEKVGASLVAQQLKESSCDSGDAGDMGSSPGLGRSPGGGPGSPLQCSCLENPVDRRAWRAAVPGVSQSQTGVKQLSRQSPRSWVPELRWEMTQFGRGVWREDVVGLERDGGERPPQLL